VETVNTGLVFQELIISGTVKGFRITRKRPHRAGAENTEQKKMKLPFLDLHIVRGKNVVSDEKLKRQREDNYIRNRVTSNLLHEMNRLRGLAKKKW
jgi:hypothetical protein